MKELKKYAEAKLSRRKFLTGSAAIGASAVAIAVAPNVASAATKTEVKVEKKDEGYQLTQHIADYYKSAAL
ncbi:MAG: twin-arginine translocation signal domain-containing protein [Cocleimonas sp.]|nr:twin-arginine translocation signal domain-containing protein [Cocleimonas sp.]